MTLPITGARFDRIGRKLADGVALDDDDAACLERVFEAYDDARQEVQARLSTLGHPPTASRLKTTTTLIDKLRREPLTIRGIDDLAGVRVILDGGRFKQDRAVEKIRASFESESKPPKLHDRRYSSSHGYRAVHIIVYVNRIPVEVQVRTELQHLWAEIVERVGDQWGRGIRYGEDPPEPDRTVDDSGQVTRAELWRDIREMGDMIDQFETVAHHHSRTDDQLRKTATSKQDRDQRKLTAKYREEVSREYRQLVRLENRFRRSLVRLRSTCDQLEGR